MTHEENVPIDVRAELTRDILQAAAIWHTHKGMATDPRLTRAEWELYEAVAMFKEFTRGGAL